MLSDERLVDIRGRVEAWMAEDARSSISSAFGVMLELLNEIDRLKAELEAAKTWIPRPVTTLPPYLTSTTTYVDGRSAPL